MFARKSSVATIENPTYNPVLLHHIRETRRHSAAPFSLAVMLPEGGNRYQTLNVSHHGKALPSQEPLKLAKGAVYDGTFLFRMGRKLFPKAASADAEGSTILRIGMRKEVHVVMEETTGKIGSAGIRGPPLGEPRYLRMKPSDESIQRSNVHDSSMPSTPNTSLTVVGERRPRRKPVPLSLASVAYRTTTQAEKESVGCPEDPQPQAWTRRSNSVVEPSVYSAPPKVLSRHSDCSPNSLASLGGAYYARKASTPLPPPIPPCSPKRAQYISHAQESPSPTTVTTVITPMRPAHVRSLGTTLKSLLTGKSGKARMACSKRGVLVTRKASLKRKRGKAAISPVKPSYQPHSFSMISADSVPTPPDTWQQPSTPKSSKYTVLSPKRLSRKRKSSLPSFLPIDTQP